MDICTQEKRCASASVGARRRSKKSQVDGHLQLSLLTGTANGALDKSVGIGLGRINLGILAGVLEALVPAEIYNRKS